MYTPTEATMEEEWEADAQEEQDDAEGEDLNEEEEFNSVREEDARQWVADHPGRINDKDRWGRCWASPLLATV